MEPCDIRPPRAEAISVGQRSLPLALLVGCASTPVLAGLWHWETRRARKPDNPRGLFSMFSAAIPRLWLPKPVKELQKLQHA